jgi:SAM-dependent methyltransferase
MTEWFEEWFGEEYLHLYPHRDERDAEALIGLVQRTLPWQPGWRVLDVACGQGRHLRVLTRLGARPIGVDLSEGLLRRAREVTDRPLVRADMRWLPVRPASMDLTLNLFTSFGYFAHDEENAMALNAMADTVRPQGWFVLDFLNADAVRRSLVPWEDATLGEVRVRVERRITTDEHFVMKTIVTPDGQRFLERVRLLRGPQLEGMFQAAGLLVTHRFGDYTGAPLAEGSPRTILIAQRA